MYAFLSYFLECEPDLHPVLLQIIEVMCSDMIPDEIQMINGFILSGDEGKTSLEVKNGLLNMLNTLLSTSMPFLELWESISGGLCMTFSILDQPNEDIRVYGLRILGLLLRVFPKHRTVFLSKYGFDFVKTLIAPYAATSKTFHTLVSLSLDTYGPQSENPNLDASSSMTMSGRIVGSGNRRSSSSPPGHNSGERHLSGSAISSSVGDPNVPIIVHPSSIRIVIELMAICSEDDEIPEVLDVLDWLGDSKNANMLFDQTWWFDCWATFLQHKDRNNHTRLFEQAHAILRKFIYHDFARNPKQMRLIRVLDMVDVEFFQIQIVETVLQLFEETPRLPNEDANNLLKSLNQFLDKLEHRVVIPTRVCFRTISLVNMLIFENTSEVRTKMKGNNLFEIRDRLVVWLLSVEMPLQERMDMLTRCAIESLAEQSCFKADGAGVLLLLRLLLEPDAVTISSPSTTAAPGTTTTATLKIIEDRNDFGDLHNFTTNNNKIDFDLTEQKEEGMDDEPVVTLEDVQITCIRLLCTIARSSDENRRWMSKILGQEGTTRLLLGVSGGGGSGGGGGGRGGGERTSFDGIGETRDDAPLTEFLDWMQCDAQTQYRRGARSRLTKALAPIQAADRKARERVEAKRAKKLKQRREELSKQRQHTLKHTAELQEKRRAFQMSGQIKIYKPTPVPSKPRQLVDNQQQRNNKFPT